MIVVEGPDGSGKTTLIETLTAHTGWPVAPRVVSKDAEAMVDLKQWVTDNVAKGFHKTIYDRHRLISEPIYGPILRQHQQPGFTDLLWLDQVTSQFWSCKPIVIYCLPPLEVVFHNIVNDDDNQVVWDHIEGIYAAYACRAALDFNLAGSRVLHWDYTQASVLSESEFFLNRLMYFVRRADV